MHDTTEDYLQIVLTIQNARTDSEVLAIVRDLAQRHGYDCFIASGLPSRGTSVKPFVLASEWPKEWFDRYIGHQYNEFDPVALRCFGADTAYYWSDVRISEDDAMGHRVMNEAREFGLVEGLCVPVRTADGMQGCISFGGRHIDDSPKTRPLLHLIALYAYGALSFMQSMRRREDAKSLGPREIEVLRWTARGKTADEVGKILGITHRTVSFHLSEASVRLGTLNKTHTVAEAMRFGLLHL